MIWGSLRLEPPRILSYAVGGMGASAARERSAPAMRSPVSWALLGLLIDRPDYGYNLFHRFQRAYGDTLELSTPSQIYAGLNGLESNGLIERLPSEHPSPDTERQQKAELQP